MSTSGNVVGKSDLMDGVSDTPDSSMNSIIIHETQLEPMIKPRPIPESQLDISISDYPALIQNENITSTPERSVSPVSRTVTPFVRPDNSHVLKIVPCSFHK